MIIKCGFLKSYGAEKFLLVLLVPFCFSCKEFSENEGVRLLDKLSMQRESESVNIRIKKNRFLAEVYGAEEQRAALLTGYVADEYAANSPGHNNDDPNVPDPEKYAWPAVIARFKKYGTADALGNTRIETFRHNLPFHFPYVGMARIMGLYPEAPKMKEHKKLYLENVWKRTGNFSPWTGEGTENHISMNHTNGYLYAQYVKNENYQSALFQDAGPKLAAMKEWILHWSKKVYGSGTAEWNSSTYGVHNIVGWLNLYDFAEDEEVKQAARAVLDYYAVELALHYTQGTTGGAEMRGSSAYRSVRTDTDYLSWLWYGDSPRKISFEGNQPIFSMYAATSGYKPPTIAKKLASKENKMPAMYYGSKPSYLFKHSSYIKQTFYVDKQYTVGAAYVPYGGWSGGDWQIVSWKLLGRVTPEEHNTSKNVDFISGGGMYYQDRGLHRKPFDQLAHHENVVVQLSKVPVNAPAIKALIEPMFSDWQAKWKADFIKRFPTESWKINQQHVNFQSQDVSQNHSFISIYKKDKNIRSEQKENVLFVQLENVFLAIRSVHQQQPSLPEATGDFYKITDVASPGVLSGFVLEAGNREDFSSFEDYKKQVLEKTSLDKSQAATANKLMYKNLKGDMLEVAYTEEGTFTEPIYDWGYGVTDPMVIITSPPFVQPQWPGGKGHGKLAKWTVNGEKVALKDDWPVYEGPHVVLENSKLILSHPDAGKSYTVDYSGAYPKFSEEDVGTGY
jgi:hypothetical protein